MTRLPTGEELDSALWKACRKLERLSELEEPPSADTSLLKLACRLLVAVLVVESVLDVELELPDASDWIRLLRSLERPPEWWAWPECPEWPPPEPEDGGGGGGGGLPLAAVLPVAVPLVAVLLVAASEVEASLDD